MTAETAPEGRQNGPESVYTLYGTTACHLCEQALAMIQALEGDVAVTVVAEVDISQSDVLFERYGLRIPVLRHPDGRELDWPFEPAVLRSFMTP